MQDFNECFIRKEHEEVNYFKTRWTLSQCYDGCLISKKSIEIDGVRMLPINTLTITTAFVTVY